MPATPSDGREEPRRLNMLPSPSDGREEPRRLNVAIVGSGIAGLTAAYAFSKEGHRVTIFEREARLGVDSTSVTLACAGGMRRIDTPPRAISSTYYPNLIALYRDAKIELQPWSWAWTYMVHGSARPFLAISGAVNGGSAATREGSAQAGAGVRFQSMPEVNDMPALLQLLRPSTLLMLLDAVRFHCYLRRDGPERCERLTLRDYLRARSIGQAFSERLLLPILAMVCTCSYEAVLEYPVVVLRSYLTSLSSHNQVRALHGTDHTAERLTALVQRVELGCAVHAVVGATHGGAAAGVLYASASSGGEARLEQFDHVLLATPADVSARLVAGSLPSLAQTLGGFRYETSEVVLHREEAVMPPQRRDWSVASVVLAADLSRAMFTLHASHPLCLAVQPEPGGEASCGSELFMTWAPLPGLLGLDAARAPDVGAAGAGGAAAAGGEQTHAQKSHAQQQTHAPASSTEGAGPGARARGGAGAEAGSAASPSEGALQLPLRIHFRRSVVSLQTKASVQQLWASEQGRGAVWVVGAFAAYSIPLQESASLSAVRVARAIGLGCAWASPTALLPPASATAQHDATRAALPAASAASRALALVALGAMAAACACGLAYGSPPLLLPLRTPPELRLSASSLGRAAFGALTAGAGSAGELRVAGYLGLCVLCAACSLAGWPWRAAVAHAPLLACAAPAGCALAFALTWSRIALWFVEHRAAFERGLGPPQLLAALPAVSAWRQPLAFAWRALRVRRAGSDLSAAAAGVAAAAASSWASAPNTFVQAYAEVVELEGRRWWASQLLAWVAVACCWAYLDWPRARMRAGAQLAYIAGGFAIAISATLPLGLAHAALLSRAQRDSHAATELAELAAAARTRPVGARWGLLLPALALALALVSTAALPGTLRSSRTAFACCLGVLHCVLALPFVARALCPDAQPRGEAGRGAAGGEGGEGRARARAARPLRVGEQAGLFALLALVCLLLHAANTRQVWRALGTAAAAASPAATGARRCSHAAALAAERDCQGLCRWLRVAWSRLAPPVQCEAQAASPALPAPSLALLCSALVRAFGSGLCIQSISIDLVLSSLAGALYVSSELGWTAGLLPYALAPIFSSGAIFATQCVFLTLFGS